MMRKARQLNPVVESIAIPFIVGKFCHLATWQKIAKQLINV
jgi:hypothetical protein